MKALVLAAAIGVLGVVNVAKADQPLSSEKWIFQGSRDEFSDKPEGGALALSADGSVLLGFFCSDHGELTSHILPNTPAMQMEFITTDKAAPVMWRVDSAPPHSERWMVMRGATSGYGLIQKGPDMPQAVSAATETIVVRVRAVTSKFPVSDAQDAIGRVLSLCPKGTKRVDATPAPKATPAPAAEPLADQGRGGGFILPASGDRLLTVDDLRGLSRDDLRLARNEIYARRGRVFQDKALADYFAAKPWYRPSKDVSLSAIERANVELILSMEQ